MTPEELEKFYRGEGNQSSRYYGLNSKAGDGRGNLGGRTVSEAAAANNGAGRGAIYEVNGVEYNAYVHKADSGQTITETLKVDFQPNILDNYDAITYHWKLFITSPAEATTGNIADPAVQTMIAESGVTDLTIDNINLRAVAPPNLITGTGTEITFKFEIVEPAGAGLMDKIFYQSLSLGVGNWITMPFYIQLEFRARDPKTSNSDISAGPNAIGNLKWIWPIKITSVKANVTTVGTRYSFEAIIYNELAQSNTYFSIQHNIVLKSILTVGDAITELEEKINFDQREKLIDNYSIPDVYKIHVESKIANYKITPPDNNKNSARNNSYIDFDQKSASFNTGTSIDKIIDTLLANTDEYQTGVVHSETPGAEGVPINKEPSQMKQFWRIVTQVRPLAFDPRRNDNAREFTIYVVPYDISVLDANTSQSEGETRETSVKRFLTYVNRNILKKKYNYIFTGLNDQIVSFDLNFNFAFASAVARYGGIYVNPSMPDKGVVNNKVAEEERAATDAVRKIISLQNSAASGRELIRAVDNYNDVMSNSSLPEETKERYSKILKMQKSSDVLNYVEGGNNQSATYYETLNYAKALAKPGTDRTPAFVSDVDIRSKEATSIFADFIATKKGNMRPVPHIEMVQDATVGQGIDSNSNSGIAKLSSMFSVALHSGVDANLISVKLTIKGDPFWLFPAPISDTTTSLYRFKDSPEEAIQYIMSNQNIQNSTANIHGTDNFILIRFRTPRLYPSGDTSTPNNGELVDVETYSGVYKVIQITSRFEMGRFVQDLECILDPNINLVDISSLIEEDAKKQDVPITVEQFKEYKNSNPTMTQSSYDPSNNPAAPVSDVDRINAQAAARIRRQG